MTRKYVTTIGHAVSKLMSINNPHKFEWEQGNKWLYKGLKI